MLGSIGAMCSDLKQRANGQAKQAWNVQQVTIDQDKEKDQHFSLAATNGGDQY